MNKAETLRLIELAQAGDKQAMKDVTEGNMGLVFNIVNRFCDASPHTHLSRDDFIQEGWFGLERAVKKFDASLGFTFSTYAHRWIKHFIQRARIRYQNLVEVPVNLVKTGDAPEISVVHPDQHRYNGYADEIDNGWEIYVPLYNDNNDLKLLLRTIDEHEFKAYSGNESLKVRNREMFSLHAHGVTLVQIAEEYGLTMSAVSLVCVAYKKELRELMV